MVKINEIKEHESILCLDGEEIGIITSFLQLNDIRLQIKRNKLSGYYIKWNIFKLSIDEYGHVSDWPLGFYDTFDKQIEELIGL